jgi:hypothetical protein
MLNLNREELSRALNGLSLDDKRELLELLESREQNKPEPLIDNRPTLDELFHSYNDQLAERSGDAAAWASANRAHQSAYEKHLARLSPPPARRTTVARHPTAEEMHALFAEAHTLVTEAIECARADGYPPASEINFRKPEEIDDPLARMRKAAGKRAPLARDELLDVVLGVTEDRQREDAEHRKARELVELAARAETEKNEKLSWFRDPEGVARQPPSYSDS